MPKRDGGVLPIGADVSPSTDPTDVRDVPVSDVMSPIVVVLAASASARDAARLMLHHGVHALPVVRSDGALVGVLSRTDLVRLLAGR